MREPARYNDILGLSVVPWSDRFRFRVWSDRCACNFNLEIAFYLLNPNLDQGTQESTWNLKYDFRNRSTRANRSHAMTKYYLLLPIVWVAGGNLSASQVTSLQTKNDDELLAN